MILRTSNPFLKRKDLCKKTYLSIVLAVLKVRVSREFVVLGQEDGQLRGSFLLGLLRNILPDKHTRFV